MMEKKKISFRKYVEGYAKSSVQKAISAVYIFGYLIALGCLWTGLTDPKSDHNGDFLFSMLLSSVVLFAFATLIYTKKSRIVGMVYAVLLIWFGIIMQTPPISGNAYLVVMIPGLAIFFIFLIAHVQYIDFLKTDVSMETDDSSKKE